MYFQMTDQDLNQGRRFQSSPSSCYSLLLKFSVRVLPAYVGGERHLPVRGGKHFGEQLCYHFEERPHNSSVKTRITTSFMLTWSGHFRGGLCNFFHCGTEGVGEWLWKRVFLKFSETAGQQNPVLSLDVIITEKMHPVMLLLLSHHGDLPRPCTVPGAFCATSHFMPTTNFQGKSDYGRYRGSQHSCS